MTRCSTRSNEAAVRSYLRQALYRLREVLPDDLSPVLRGDRFCLPGPELVSSGAAEVLAAFAQAATRTGRPGWTR